MTALALCLENATTLELEAAIRLLHVAGVSQRRLLGAWRRPSRDELEPSFPPVLAAMCLELYAALGARGDRNRSCPACLSTVVAAGVTP